MTTFCSWESKYRLLFYIFFNNPLFVSPPVRGVFSLTTSLPDRGDVRRRGQRGCLWSQKIGETIESEVFEKVIYKRIQIDIITSIPYSVNINHEGSLTQLLKLRRLESIRQDSSLPKKTVEMKGDRQQDRRREIRFAQKRDTERSPLHRRLQGDRREIFGIKS